MSKALCDFAIKNILAYANQFTLSSQSPMCTKWMVKHFRACKGFTSIKVNFSIVYCREKTLKRRYQNRGAIFQVSFSKIIKKTYKSFDYLINKPQSKVSFNQFESSPRALYTNKLEKSILRIYFCFPNVQSYDINYNEHYNNSSRWNPCKCCDVTLNQLFDGANTNKSKFE